MFCPSCGAAHQPNQKFCSSCGATLPGATGAPPAPPTPPVASAPPPTPAPPPVSTAQLHPIPDGGLTIEEVAAWLQRSGFSARIDTAPSGSRHIVSSSQGTPFNIFMGDCNKDRCSSLEFSAGFARQGKFDVSQLNAWNEKNRWVRAYYDSVNDPWLELDVDLYPGGTWESLDDQFGVYNKMLAKFISTYSLL